MNLELLTIGTELLLGFTVDTNSAHIAQTLGAAGIRVARRTSVADEASQIAEAVQSGLSRTGVVLTTGGLGPTSDDLTKNAVADLFGVPLEFQETIWASLVERFRRLGREPSPLNRSQAMVPKGAVVLPNQWGTAPGLWLEAPAGLVIMLPGVPHEMRKLLEHEVLPRLAARGVGVVRSRLLRTTGIAESSLAERLNGLEDVLAPMTLAYLPSVDGIDLRLTAWNAAAAEADGMLSRGVTLLRERIESHVYAEGDITLAEMVVRTLKRLGWRIAVAESCTGGLVGVRLTDVPGSSAVFQGGVIAYDNAVKTAELGVPPRMLEAHGAVSEPVVRRMAEGVRERLGTQVGLGVTGIAGPGGGTPEKPVGTVWLAVSEGLGTEAVKVSFLGGRAEIRARAAQALLNLALRRLRQREVAQGAGAA